MWYLFFVPFPVLLCFPTTKTFFFILNHDAQYEQSEYDQYTKHRCTFLFPIRDKLNSRQGSLKSSVFPYTCARFCVLKNCHTYNVFHHFHVSGNRFWQPVKHMTPFSLLLYSWQNYVSGHRRFQNLLHVCTFLKCANCYTLSIIAFCIFDFDSTLTGTSFGLTI